MTIGGYLLLFIGGGCGMVARQMLSQLFNAPWGVVAVNLAGCLAMGLLVALIRPAPLLLLFLTGVLGGFTTFATFIADGWRLSQHETSLLPLLLYVASQLLGGLALFYIGLMAGRQWLS